VGRKTNKQRRAQSAVSAREKAAIARAEQQRAEQRRRALVILSSVVAVVILAVVIVVIVINQPKKNDPSGNRVAASASIVKDVTSIAPATFSTVGEGGAQVTMKKITGPPLTANGKPELLFIGGEFCPICAAERWSITAALSRFGTFSNLSQLRSATDDGNIATLSFYKSTYTSKYLTFVPVENVDRAQKPLQNLTKAQQAVYTKVAGTSQLSYPFLDFGGEFAQQSEGYDGTVLGALNQTQIAGQLNNPKSKIAQAIDGEANNLTAAICSMTKNQPATVCTAPAITSIQSKISA
jgi:Domain of unknown function (DUF929)